MSAGPDYPAMASALGCRRCYRIADLFHRVDNPDCDCLRVELPIEAQARSSGALGTPDRDTTCEECGGAGRTLEWSGFMCREVRCPVCAGKGGLSPAEARRLARSDRAVREELSKARSAGKVGAR